MRSENMNLSSTSEYHMHRTCRKNTVVCLFIYTCTFYRAIELYHGKMRWLNQGSMKVQDMSGVLSNVYFLLFEKHNEEEKKQQKNNYMYTGSPAVIFYACQVFGLVKGSRVGVIVDVSDANCTEERLVDLQVNLLVGDCVCVSCCLQSQYLQQLRLS